MDMEQSKLIDKYERLFAEEGWKELVSDFKDRMSQLKDLIIVDTSLTEPKLKYLQGQHFVYDYIINLERTVETIKQSQQELDLPEVSES